MRQRAIQRALPSTHRPMAVALCFSAGKRGSPRITFIRILPRSSQADLVYYVISWIHAVFPYISAAVAVSFVVLPNVVEASMVFQIRMFLSRFAVALAFPPLLLIMAQRLLRPQYRERFSSAAMWMRCYGMPGTKMWLGRRSRGRTRWLLSAAIAWVLLHRPWRCVRSERTRASRRRSI